MDAISSTAFWVAAARARESVRPDALFHDPFAAALAGEEGERWVREAPENAAMLGAFIAIRTLFFDEELARAAASGVRQVVILAAGLDARAYRLDWPAGTRVFEIDRPAVLAHKGGVLAAAGATPRCDRVTLGADLTLPFGDRLRAAGFAADERSAWLVEGLLPYLHEPDVHYLLAQITSLSTPGSALALDATGVDLFSAPSFARMAAQLTARGIHMHFGCDDPVGLLDTFGWRATRHGPRELAARAGRTLVGRAESDDPARAYLVSASRRG